VGMLIHLDGGWMSHPFPRSSFKISSLDQIATLRSLGIEKVRWTPADTPDEPLPPDVTAIRRGSAAGRRQRREVSATTPRALNGGERQFSEAAKKLRRVFDQVAAQPAEARLIAEGLTRGLVGKMMGAEDMCIQLLGQTAGDRVSNHAVNVSVLSLLMGRYFALCESDMLDLGLGALLHDVGKSELPDRYRHREGHFNMAEISLHESHVASGIVHAQRLGLSDGATTIIAQHHECSDGHGFPLGLSTERTHMLSRIVALVNCYDNLCNPTNVALSITPHEAVAHLFTQNHKQFDTAILGAFIKMMGVYPAGSVVQLTDDRYALVVGVNSSRTLRPRVVVHDPKVPREEARVLDLETVPGLGIRRSLKPSALPDCVLAYLEPQPRMSYFFEPTADLRSAK
jgi:putative nucleotidyltransferase with HDIG domain